MTTVLPDRLTHPRQILKIGNHSFQFRTNLTTSKPTSLRAKGIGGRRRMPSGHQPIPSGVA